MTHFKMRISCDNWEILFLLPLLCNLLLHHTHIRDASRFPVVQWIEFLYSKKYFFLRSYGAIRSGYGQHFGPQGGQDSGFPSPRSALGYPFPTMQNSYSSYHLGGYAPPCASPPKDGKSISFIDLNQHPESLINHDLKVLQTSTHTWHEKQLRSFKSFFFLPSMT